MIAVGWKAVCITCLCSFLHFSADYRKNLLWFCHLLTLHKFSQHLELNVTQFKWFSNWQHLFTSHRAGFFRAFTEVLVSLSSLWDQSQATLETFFFSFSNRIHSFIVFFWGGRGQTKVVCQALFNLIGNVEHFQNKCHCVWFKLALATTLITTCAKMPRKFDSCSSFKMVLPRTSTEEIQLLCWKLVSWPSSLAIYR